MSGTRWTEDQLAARLAKPQPGRATASEAGNVPEATGEAVKASPAASNTRRRYVVGIDPGEQTGFAVWDRESRVLVEVFTTDFWGAYDKLLAMPPDTVRVIVETSQGLPTFKHLKGQAASRHALAKIAVNVGGVIEKATLLAAGLRLRGYEVAEVKPRGKKDAAAFAEMTGWHGRTNQHERDAGLLAIGA